jgi:hypothetical protein
MSFISEKRPKACAAFGKSQISQDTNADKGSKNGKGEPLPLRLARLLTTMFGTASSG